MANIFQKIFLSPEEVGLIDIINDSNIQYKVIYDNDHMAATAQYSINKDNATVLATYNWHYAQGDKYSLNINLPRHSLAAANEQFAKKIFIRMEKTYRKQKEH